MFLPSGRWDEYVRHDSAPPGQRESNDGLSLNKHCGLTHRNPDVRHYPGRFWKNQNSRSQIAYETFINFITGNVTQLDNVLSLGDKLAKLKENAHKGVD